MSSTVMNLAVLLFCVIALSSNGVDAMMCYSCNSTITPSCGDAFSTSAPQVACPSGQSCFKTRLVMPGSTASVSRGCVPGYVGDTCPGTSILGYGADYCVCSGKDLCNPAPSVHTAKLTGVLAAVLASFVLLRRVL